MGVTELQLLSIVLIQAMILLVRFAIMVKMGKVNRFPYLVPKLDDLPRKRLAELVAEAIVLIRMSHLTHHWATTAHFSLSLKQHGILSLPFGPQSV